VVSYGPVQVPYGTVNAFKILVHNTDREVKRANPVETYWYSPDIGYFVSTTPTSRSSRIRSN